MTTFVIDNTPVSLELEVGEFYSVSGGSVQKLKVVVPSGMSLGLNGDSIVNNDAATNVSEITVIGTDRDAFKNRGGTPGDHIRISGFEVN